MSGEITLLAVGDVIPDREDPGSLFDHVRPVLADGSLAFCQLETVLSRRGSPLPQSRLPTRGDPGIARAIREAGFDVVSFASNHCLDWGPEALLDTLENLRQQGLAAVGAGANLDEARAPAILERGGTRVAFLAYNSILPQGYWAEADRPGCAPLRAFTFYEQVEHDQPGTPALVHTFPHRGDLAALLEDVTRARARADVVVVSLHWGIHFVPAVLADYQRDVAHAAVDAGADLILGHHPHILKGIEVYNGKAIFYSLCNFALDLRANAALLASPRHQELARLNPEWRPDPEYPSYYLPPDSRKTMIARCTISEKRITRVSFLPTYINPRSQPEVLGTDDPHFHAVLSYVEDISRSQGLDTCFTVAGGDVAVTAPADRPRWPVEAGQRRQETG